MKNFVFNRYQALLHFITIISVKIQFFFDFSSLYCVCNTIMNGNDDGFMNIYSLDIIWGWNFLIKNRKSKFASNYIFASPVSSSKDYIIQYGFLREQYKRTNRTILLPYRLIFLVKRSKMLIGISGRRRAGRNFSCSAHAQFRENLLKYFHHVPKPRLVKTYKIFFSKFKIFEHSHSGSKT